MINIYLKLSSLAIQTLEKQASLKDIVRTPFWKIEKIRSELILLLFLEILMMKVSVFNFGILRVRKNFEHYRPPFINKLMEHCLFMT